VGLAILNHFGGNMITGRILVSIPMVIKCLTLYLTIFHSLILTLNIY